MIACDFKYNDSGVVEICKEDVGDGGILCLSQADKTHIIGVNFRGRSADQKFLEMVSYQFELAYDLRTINFLEFKTCGNTTSHEIRKFSMVAHEER